MKESFYWLNQRKGTFNQYVEAPLIEFEQQLANSLSPIAPPIGLGDGREGDGYIGIGRAQIPPETEWRDVVAKLATDSLMNFIVPSYHEGTKWEIGFIIERQLTEKTLFLVPDAYGNNLEKFQDWLQLTKTSMRMEFGIDISQFDHRQYFELKDGKRIETPPELKSLKTKHIRRFLDVRKILPDDSPSLFGRILGG